VDWARSCGFEVTAAGKGTRYLPDYHSLTPDTVWAVLQQYLDIDDPESINLQMFNSFLDGSKSAIEMTAVCNATGLIPQDAGLQFPSASRFELADICKPSSDGGVLTRSGTTEVVSSLTRAGETVAHHLAMGTFVVIQAGSDYARQCLREYHMLPDKTGQYGALYRPTHMIGLELGVSIASVALRGEPTGQPMCFSSDVVAIAKRDLKIGELLDGEGGHCVFGRQMPSEKSLSARTVPLGLSAGMRLIRNVASGQMLCQNDVDVGTPDEATLARDEMVSAFAPHKIPPATQQ
jgi:predicted homoserine dehydrogenase-like protein